MKDIFNSFKSFITLLITVFIFVITALLIFLPNDLDNSVKTTLLSSLSSVFVMIFTFYFVKKDEDGGKEQKAMFDEIEKHIAPVEKDDTQNPTYV